MPSRIRAFTVASLSFLPTFLILALLAAVAVWGARHHWKVPRLAEIWGDEDDRTPQVSKPMVKVYPDPDHLSSDASEAVHSPMRIEFPSAAVVTTTGLKVAPVQVRRMAHYVTAYGMIDYDPSFYAELATRASGTIWQVHKEIGEHVAKGEVLALVESAEVGKAKADFLQSLAQVDVRQRALQRMHSAGDSVSDAIVREAEAALREARIRLFNDQQRLLNLGFTLRLEDVSNLAEDQLVRYLRVLGVPERLRKEVDAETLTANLLPLTAPFEGQIVSRKAAPGEVVGPGQPQFIVADVRHIHIDLDVAPEDMRLLRLEQSVRFTPQDGSAEPVIGRLSHISPEVNEKTRKVQVHAEAANPGNGLRPHTFGTGRILIREEADAVALPSAAIQSHAGAHLVFVRLSPTVFQSRQVQAGLRADGFTQVSGMRTGEEVVTTGSHVLKSELLKDRIASGED
jgi:cobalt-zinc-cadmium efflux system membrane fusion protein